MRLTPACPAGTRHQQVFEQTNHAHEVDSFLPWKMKQQAPADTMIVHFGDL